MTIDNSAIKPSELAAVLKAHSLKFQPEIFQQLFMPGVNEGNAARMITPVTDYALPIMTSDKVILTAMGMGGKLQPGAEGTKGFTPKKNTNFRGRIGRVNHIKVDDELTQQEIMRLQKSYLGQAYAGKYDPQTYPFAAEVVAMIMKTMTTELRMSLWKAVDNPSGDTNLDLFDGWLKQITLAIQDDSIPDANILTSGTISKSNILSVLDELPGLIPTEELISDDIICLCSRAFQNMYRLAYRDKYGHLPYNSAEEKKVIVGCDIPFVIEPGLDGYNKPLFLHRNNLAYLYEDEGAMQQLDFEYSPKTRSIAYMADFQAGAAIARPEKIWTAI
jgi:hypothetical protein